MTKLLLPLAATAALAGGFAALSAPALAQSGDRVSEIIVYGTDPCPRSTDDEVVVCARKPRERALPDPRKAAQQRTLARARQAWANRARALETVGATGINSCSPVGPAGFTGCLTQVIKQARAESQRNGDRATRRPSNRLSGFRLLRRDPGVDLRFQRIQRHRSPGPAPRRGSGAGRTWRPSSFSARARSSSIFSSPIL